MADPKHSENAGPGAGAQPPGRPALFGCMVLLVAALVLGGAFLLGAWSVVRGYGPPDSP